MTDLKGLTNKRSGIAAYPLTESDIAAANLCMQEAFPPGEQFPIEQLLRFAAADPAVPGLISGSLISSLRGLPTPRKCRETRTGRISRTSRSAGRSGARGWGLRFSAA